ncbi:Peptidase M1, alanine aminopeptidase/leukotriene A4 hydrolase [Corchorus capsularis]|uniref:Aminopeptidase n=1 Tax=Corchorus capsularis TaxID=210143 RepID=A0A1R3H9E9_COCAP|nr:Peptidase M1, alanine aminopeptidase/leukotriene A4 hydrolase [Corchorus capsularis]
MEVLQVHKQRKPGASTSSDSSQSSREATSSQFKGQPRLPKFAVPKRYDIHLKPDLKACKFSGSVSIELDIVADTRFIVLNAAHLSINPASVSFNHPDSSKVLQATKVGVVEADEILVLDFAETLPKGMGLLSIRFDGVLNDQMKGFYTSIYEHNGEKKNMAVTQFEPAYARQCFPCWDEPAFKAKFKITLLDVPSELVTLSNMPVMEKKENGHLKTVYFEESPLMSTYLVAVVIGLFDYIEAHTLNGIKVRVYCQVGKSNQGKFALDVAVKTLEYYKDYFDMPYPLSKLDMVAIPDFAFGAMENFGLVTYRETALLYDDQHSAAANKQRVATVVAHELAHQWFGNLVTMEWWTDLWLNEGFATWVSYLANDKLFPEWKVWTQFLDHECSEGLRLDGLAESHPIEVEVNHASEIQEIFDTISYRKGASVIRMLRDYVGGQKFQNSLASYIKRHAWSNAKTEDLWTALKEGCDEPVNKIMNSWTKQKGYPVVSVKMKNQKLEIEQSQFLYSGSHGKGQWIIPMTLCCGDYESRKSFLMEKKAEIHDIKGFFSDTDKSSDPARSWIKLNVDQIGFFRVKYDEALGAKLRYAIENKYLSITDRLGILDDSFALCMARQMSLASLLTFLGAYQEELEHTVLSNLIKITDKVGRVVADAKPELMNYIKQFFIGLFLYSAEKLGWDPKQGESHLDAMSRGDVFTALAMLGHEETLIEGTRRFHAFLENRNTPLLHPDIRKAAYVAVMQKVNTTNRTGFESLLRVYRETDQSQEKVRVLGSLASCPDQGIILEALNFALSAEVRSQDAVFGLAVSKEGREVAWKWFKDNWDPIWKTYGSGNLVTRFVSSVVSPFASSEKVKEVKEFFTSRTKPSMARTLKQSIEQVEINAKWVQSIKNEKQLTETVNKLAIRKY